MPRKQMKGKKRFAKRRGRRSNATNSVPRPGTSFQARDKQWLGFYGETTGITPGAGNGAFFVAIDPTGCAGFRERFGFAWQSWRMVGWKVSVNIKAKSTSAAQNFPNAMNPVAPFEFANLPTASIPVAPTIDAFAEVPNCKYMSIFPGSPHCRKTFSWRATDINFLPFQTFDVSLKTTLSQTGIWGFIDMSDYQEELDIQVMGHILVEFKDAQLYILPGKKTDDLPEEMRDLQLKSPTTRVRRLNA